MGGGGGVGGGDSEGNRLAQKQKVTIRNKRPAPEVGWGGVGAAGWGGSPGLWGEGVGEKVKER